MLGKCFFVMTALSVVFAVATGRIDALSNALIDGAGRAVTLTLSLMGMMALWSGVMRVFREMGAIGKLSKLLSPVLSLVFPTAFATGRGKEEITAAVSANILGMGNATTPLALAAMGEMQKDNPTPDTATDDMVMLSVLATASFNILPTTLIALRRSAGAQRPYAILLPVAITSGICSLFSILLCRLSAAASRPRKERRGRRGHS